MDKTINKNIVLNAIKSTSSIIFPLLVYPYVLRVLGADSVGKVNFGNSIVSYFLTFASLGMTNYAVRECSRVKDNPSKLAEVGSQLFSINLLATLLSYIVLLAVIQFEQLRSYQMLILLQSLAIICTTLGADWLNTAMSDFKYITMRTLLFQGLSLIAIYLFVKGPEDYLIYAAILVLSSSGGNILNIFYRRRYCTLRFTFDEALLMHLKKIIPFFLLMIAQTVYVNGGTTILGLFKGDYEVGIFSTAHRIYQTVNSMVASISLVMIPTVSNLFAKGEQEKLNETLSYALRFILIVGIPCIIGINATCNEIISAFAGDGYVDAIMPLRILSIAMFFSFLGGYYGSIVLIPTGREKICLISSVTAAAVGFILFVVLIPPFGVNGTAVAIVIAELSALLIVGSNAHLELHFQGGLAKLVATLLTGNAAIVIICLLCGTLDIGSVTMLFCKVILSILAYIMILFFFREPVLISFLHRRRQDG